MPYVKKEFFDPTGDILDVIIHYTVSPLAQPADWTRTESRSMPAGEILRSGVGEIAKYGPPAPSIPQHTHPRLRKKVLSLPGEVFDPAINDWNPEYLVHYFFEIVRENERTTTDVIVDEIRARDVVLYEPLGVVAGTCVNWSVQDWDAPQFSPTEDPEFFRRFGEDHPLRQIKFYGTPDQEAFAVAKSALVDSLPLPRRFGARVQAPVGATVVLRLHVGDWGLPVESRWEDYWLLDTSFAMSAGLEPLVLTPLGTDVAPAPLQTVAPELLAGNPYLPFIPGYGLPLEGQVVTESAPVPAEAPAAASERELAGVS